MKSGAVCFCLLFALGLFSACDDDTTPLTDAAPQDTMASDASVTHDGPTPDRFIVDTGPKADGPNPDLGKKDTGDSDGAKADIGTGPCAKEVAALATELYKVSQACTAVIRLDHNTLTLKGYQLVCGPPKTVTEAQARATAQTDTGYGSSGQALNPPSPADEFVFYMAPGDFGGASSVSADTGLSVFGGSIIWMGTGQITYPKTWRQVSTLGSGCAPGKGIPSAVGYDLVSTSQPLPTADVNKVLAIVKQTAIPAAMWSGGKVHDAVVLRYPRSVGMFNPNTAEWIALINGGTN